MRLVVLPLLLVLALLPVAGVQAQSRGQASPPQDQSQAAPPPKSNRQSLPATVRRVERETGGEVISAEPVRRDGREVYNLKVLTPNGRVKVVQDDPEPRRERQDRDQRQPRDPEPPRRRDRDDDGGGPGF